MRDVVVQAAVLTRISSPWEAALFKRQWVIRFIALHLRGVFPQRTEGVLDLMPITTGHPMLLHTCLLGGITRTCDLFLFAQWAWPQNPWELNFNTQPRIFIDAPVLWTASRLARNGSVEAVVASGMSESVNLLPSGRNNMI